MASLTELSRLGQSIWLDFIDRDLVLDGGLQRLVDSGVTGVTTNPSIFHKAIGSGNTYDNAIRELIEQDHGIDEVGLCENLMIADVRVAADVLRPVFDASVGRDGYVSLEVAPDLAYEVEQTIAAGRRLWQAVSRPNVMIKVPGTAEGVRAFERLIAEGINVNVTLLFSVARYEEVVRAWARGLARNPHPERIASVASFFVSRVDTKVDRLLDERGTEAAARLRGKIAIANARLAYRRFQDLLRDPEIAAQIGRGARPQRPLWASTGAKDPKYRDVCYVEALIGKNTVNTLPPETLDRFLYHGEARDSVTLDVEVAQRQVSALADLSIDLNSITRELESEGVAAFRDAWNKLLASLRQKCLMVTKDYAGS